MLDEIKREATVRTGGIADKFQRQTVVEYSMFMPGVGCEVGVGINQTENVAAEESGFLDRVQMMGGAFEEVKPAFAGIHWRRGKRGGLEHFVGTENEGL